MRTSAGHAILKFVSVVLLACLLVCSSFPVYAEYFYEKLEDDPNYGDNLSETDKLYNSLPHPYLAGYYSEDGSEITITGMKISSKDLGEPTYVFQKDIVIPDEIGGVPVTAVAESAFEFYNDKYHCRPEPKTTVMIGKNVRSVGYLAFNYFDTVIVGKNVIQEDRSFCEEHIIYCYENSYVYDRLQTYPSFTFAGQGWYTITFIDESHLISDKVKIDEALNVYLPWGVTKETLGDYVSVDGDARINVLGDTIENGTQIELVNSTYGTVDNTYTVVLEKPQITVTAEPQRTAFAKTTFSLDAKVTTTGEPCKLTFASDNPDVAAVDENGVVTT
ncbi:MAG: hypothetical protein IJT41_02835, partial [Clostridia bacterium]|nr:hypothetical protein [Clostridia bacterium]